MRYQLTIGDAEKLSKEQIATILRHVANCVETHGPNARVVNSSVPYSTRYYLPDVLVPDLF